MRARIARLIGCAAMAILLLAAALAPAAELRFHYAPADAYGNTSLKPADRLGVGEQVRWFGAVRETVRNQPRPTHVLTFLHPYTLRAITVPVTLPAGTPRLEHVRDRVVYNYGSYAVEARFFRDGSVDVVYNAGLFRMP